MKVTMKDVAQKAGVSTATVSHVINKTRFVEKETKNKVLKVMKKLDYYPNFAAQSLRSKKSNVIGLIVPDISNFFFTAVIRGIESTLKKYEYTLILADSDENLEIEKEQIRVFNAKLIDGLIIAPANGDHIFLEKLLNRNSPVVFIDRKPQSYCPGDCVLVDNVKGAYKAVSILIKRGHSRIGVITGVPGLTTSEERLEGYKRALADYGIKVEQNLIKIGDGRYDSGYKLMKELLLDSNITALFVVNNLMTIGAIKFLKEKQIKIPGDLAIIGFDDYKWASITNPPLSVVKQPSRRIGEKASELLIRRIKKEETGDYKEYRLPTELVIRESF
ncbi:MAG: LacI family DNA-binding transcriptional regulator [Thermodesulfobacteriota bacterium]|nr:LacI family DNA-binding transcriptional regulator [Thermodesulfobacteriota bacterium]